MSNVYDKRVASELVKHVPEAIKEKKKELSSIKRFRLFSSIDPFISNVGRGAIRERLRPIVYQQGIRRPLYGQGRKTGKRGRPSGPSGKYYIPGVGAVGVYEYRMWLRSQLRQKRVEIQRQQTLSPEQRQALYELEARRRSSQSNPENRTIVDTQGQVPLRSVHQEADDYANLVP